MNKFVVFLIIFVAYSICYISKRSPGYWAKDVIQQVGGAEGAGAVSASTAGAFASAFESLGGISKLACGFLVDWFSPTLVLAGSLGAVGVAHLALLAPATLAGKASIWGANGFAQAFAWPALARIFMAWFPDPASRGKVYALLATSQNAGAAVAPYLLPPLAAAFGWQSNIIAPGLLALASAVAVLALVRDAPASARAAGAAAVAAAVSPAGKAVAAGPAVAAKPAAAAGAAPPPAAASGGVGILDTVRLIITSPTLWLLGINYLFNTLVRNALTEVPDSLLGAGGLGLSKAGRAAAVSAYEVGAAIGGLTAGYISDRFFDGRRGPIMALASFAVAPLPLLLVALGAAAPAQATTGISGGGGSGGILASVAGWLTRSVGVETAVAVIYGTIGVTAFGPHVLNGLASREFSNPRVQSSAGGFTKSLGQLGGTIAGSPVGWIIDTYGWQAAMGVLSAACIASGVAGLPLWNTRAYGAPAAGSAAAGASAAAAGGESVASVVCPTGAGPAAAATAAAAAAAAVVAAAVPADSVGAAKAPTSPVASKRSGSSSTGKGRRQQAQQQTVELQALPGSAAAPGSISSGDEADGGGGGAGAGAVASGGAASADPAPPVTPVKAAAGARARAARHRDVMATPAGAFSNWQ